MASGMGSPQRGFTFLELAFVLVVIGVLGLLAKFAFSGADDVRQQQLAQAQAEAAREALRYYVLANKRLPCPDFNENGYEDRGSDGRCSQSGEIGFVPYYSIGLTPDDVNRMTYGVYRASGTDDITFLAERTGDSEGQPDYMNLGDAIVALSRIPVAVNTAHIHVAGVNANGSSNCNTAVSTHPAFVLIVPNTNRDNVTNSLLDGVNALANNCIASPLQPLAWNYDDVVAVESSNALIGWLTKHIN